MSQQSAPIKLSVIGAASTAEAFDDATAENTLLVAKIDGDEQERVYWKGERLNGHIDHTRPMARSITHPVFTLLIDGEPVLFGSGSVYDPTFVFRDETLYVHGAGFEVDYDAEADRPVL